MLAALILGCSANSAGATEYRAFWLDAFHNGFYNQSQVDTLLGVPGTTSGGQIRDVNCNAVVIQVRKRADVCYPSGVGEPYMSGLSPADFNALAALIKAAHDTTGGKKRIEVHCWSVAFKTAKGVVYSQHSDTPTGSLTTFDNYWPTRVSSTTGAENADGSFDPGHPKALEYLVNAHMDLVNFQTTAGLDGTDGHIDGIHYDYIRFEANTEGYNPTSVARYNARYGLSGDPASTSEQFKQWRRDQVTAFVRQMYARIQKTKPWVKQSGAFVTWNPSPTTSTRTGFQATRPYYDVYSDWDSWIQEGLVDLAVPMTYYDWGGSYPADFTRWMNFEKDRHGSRHMVIGPGIYLNSLANAILELQMTRDASTSGNYADGFCGYSYGVPYVSGTWAGFSPSLVSQVTPTWDDIPSMPWKTSPTTGHMMGTVTIAGTGAWADGATVSITGPGSRVQTNDGTGFFAFIDLPPGSYTVTASKAGYPDASAVVNVAVGAVTGNMYQQDLVLGGNTPPSITTQPSSQTVSQGANSTFTVSASGTAPLSYQWRLYATNIAGATASSYTRANVLPADAGPYSVIVTNVAGSVTSSDAILTVETNINPPVIVSQPSSQTVIAGQSATFTVTASGTGPLSYQWRFNAAAIPGATTSAYTRANIQTSDAGSYSVVATNAAGSATSADAVLTVNFSLAATATAGGTVSKSPDQTSYAPNAVVTLTATADPNFAFTGWSGDASGTNNPLGVTMTANKAIAASFTSTATDVILDNTNAAVTFSGAWTTATASTDKYGSDYRWASTAVGGTSTATYRPSIYTPGYYDIYIWYPQGSNRATNAPWSVFYDGGSINASVNQQVNGGAWVLIADARLFAQGTNGYVLLSNSTGYSGSVVMADAVRFSYVGPSGTAPVITLQPQSQAVTPGASVTFTVAASGSTPLSYQWRFNSGNISGATASSYTISDVQLSDAGGYSVVVSNLAGSATSSNATLTVNVPPSITAQPEDQNVFAGANATFTVTASGAQPLSYQWRFNGTNIAAASASSYTRNNVQPADAGSYSVVVANSLGSVTSAPAVLIVNCSLTTVVSGGGAIYKNPDQASYAPSALVTLVAAPVLGWNFSSWSGGASGTANPLTVTLTASLTITANFTSTVPDLIVDNTNATFAGTWTTTTATDDFEANYRYASTVSGSVTATATFTPTITTAGNYDVFVWYPTLSSSRRSAAVPYLVSYNGGSNNIIVSQQSGQGSWQLIASAKPFAAGTSGLVQMANNTGESSKRVAADAVRWVYSANQDSPPVIIAQPQSQTADAGSIATFTTLAAGAAPLSYQWRFNGTPIVDAADSTYTRSNLQPADAGTYAVVVNNAVGSVTSSTAVLTVNGGPVNVAPSISTQPQNQDVNQTSNAVFSVVATGTPAPSYQWRKNGTPIGGATGTSYTVANAQPADVGSYSVVVSNIAGMATSTDALLTVNVPPTITDQPQSVTATVGSNVTFTVTATGTSPLSYQWRFNGINLAYATASAYTCNNAQTNDAGSYSVVVSNIAGVLASAEAVLAVTQPTPSQIDSIGLLPNGQIELQVSGAAGDYALEATTNLADWADLTSFTVTNTTFHYLDTETNITQRFYRTRRMR